MWGAVLLSLFKRRRFPVEIILLCVRWYCKYGISYRDIAEIMEERGVAVGHRCINLGRIARSGSSRIRSRVSVQAPSLPG